MPLSDVTTVLHMGVRSKLVRFLRWEMPERPYECRQCGIHLDVEYYTCPSCGSFSVERRSAYI